MDVSSMTDDLKWFISDDYRFPVCLHKLETDEHSNNHGILHQLNQHLHSNPKQFLFLVLTIFNGALQAGIETSTVVYFTPYMKHKHDATLITSTSQLAIFATFTAIGTQILKLISKIVQQRKIILDSKRECDDDDENKQNKQKKKNKDTEVQTDAVNNGIIDDDNDDDETLAGKLNSSYRYDFSNLYVQVLIATSGVLAFFTIIILPDNNITTSKDLSATNTKFYLSFILCGIVYGMSFLANELIIIELIKKNIAGSMVGTKIFIRIIGKACVVLIVGLNWKNTEESLWYTQGICQMVVIVNVVVIAVIETFF